MKPQSSVPSRNLRTGFTSLLLFVLLISTAGCVPRIQPGALGLDPTSTQAPTAKASAATPLPTRPLYTPGELVDYTAQTGDTLPFLAVRFNTTEAEIRAANPIIPSDATTMPPGMPMKIPIYYQPFWGSPYQILPDSLFVDGPAQVGFDTIGFVKSQPGWLKDYQFFVGDRTLVGGELVDQVATDYSLSPRLLLAIIEFQSHALSDPTLPDNDDAYYLGQSSQSDRGMYRQLLWLANFLNDTYYSFKSGLLTQWDLQDGRIERPDPWQNAASVALQYYFGRILPVVDYQKAISSSGLSATYKKLFGDPWNNVKPHIPGSLVQPPLDFPFPAGHTWAFTGGPHTGWGSGQPYAALDFAPPAVASGCLPSNEWATAVADGIVARTGNASIELDLDGDGHTQTGWVIFYLHLSNASLVPAGTKLKAGDPVGHPSCEGGNATGTHVHVVRKFNGEWIPGGGTLAYNLEGWVAHAGSVAYEGTLVKATKTIRACTCSDQYSFVTAGGN
ncbi:MAG TPA: LysM peptidoglycan-binding domain-containing protein [Anaerolineaceae bacterium]|nr:LysM peptidoglycan-binding domain-containing protein [Anaerolineaceae bacterium]